MGTPLACAARPPALEHKPVTSGPGPRHLQQTAQGTHRARPYVHVSQTYIVPPPNLPPRPHLIATPQDKTEPIDLPVYPVEIRGGKVFVKFV